MVVTTIEWGKDGLLFVDADYFQPELPMDQFFFKPKDTEDVFTILFDIRSTDTDLGETRLSMMPGE